MNKRSLKLLGLTSLLFSLCAIPVLEDENEVSQVGAATDAVKAEVQRLNEPATIFYTGNFYDGITAKKGKTLRDQLHSLIRNWNTSASSYDNLYNVYKDSDARPDGTVWDTYGDFSFSFSNKAGSYNKEGDCYNREHSIPASWFGDRSPMYYDAFHLMPTDGYVNNRRGNYPFGEVGNSVTYTYSFNNYVSGTNKLGSSKTSGISGTVFEPADCYKGDYARNYFYFITCYYTDNIYESAGSSYFSRSTIDVDKQFGLTTAARDLLIKWHTQDPVSQKEVNRVEGVYKTQKNRNPFIDHPELVNAIWGDGEYNGGGGTTVQVPTLIINNNDTDVTGGTVNLKVGESISLSGIVSGSKNSSVTWEISGSAAVGNKSADGTYTVTGTQKGDSTVTAKIAYADAGTTKYVSKQVTIKVAETTGGGGGGIILDGDLVAVTATSQLEDGDVVVLKTDNGAGAVLSGNAQSTSSTKDSWTRFEAIVSSGQLKLKNLTTNQYIASVSKNAYSEDETGTALTIDDKGLLYQGTRVLCINGSYVRFYSNLGSYTALRVYKLVAEVPPAVKTLDSISYTGSCQTSYDIGETFDPRGLTVLASFSDGSSVDVTDEVVWIADTSISGDRTVVGTYTFDGVSKVVTFTIHVEEEIPPIIDDDDDDDPPVIDDDDDDPPVIDDDDNQGGENETDENQGTLDNIPGMNILDQFGLGCSGNVTSTSLIVFLTSLVGVSLIFLFKKKEN